MMGKYESSWIAPLTMEIKKIASRRYRQTNMIKTCLDPGFIITLLHPSRLSCMDMMIIAQNVPLVTRYYLPSDKT